MPKHRRCRKRQHRWKQRKQNNGAKTAFIVFRKTGINSRKGLDKLRTCAIMHFVRCGCSSSGRAPPCQGGGSEFEPRHPLHKNRTDLKRSVLFLWKAADEARTIQCKSPVDSCLPTAGRRQHIDFRQRRKCREPRHPSGNRRDLKRSVLFLWKAADEARTMNCKSPSALAVSEIWYYNGE